MTARIYDSFHGWKPTPAQKHGVPQLLRLISAIDRIIPQTVWLTLGVLMVVVKARGARSRCRTEFAIYALSCLHVRFVCEFS